MPLPLSTAATDDSAAIFTTTPSEAAQAPTQPVLPSTHSTTQHGLGTLQWFRREPLDRFVRALGGEGSSRASDIQGVEIGSGFIDSSSSTSGSKISLEESVQLQHSAASTVAAAANHAPTNTAGPAHEGGVLHPPSFTEQAWEQAVMCSNRNSISNSEGEGHSSAHNGREGDSSRQTTSNRECVITFRGQLVRPRPQAEASQGSSVPSTAQDHNQHSLSGTSLPPTGTVVLLHGFLGSHADWRTQMHGLAALGHTSLALDLPGHGGTSTASVSHPSSSDNSNNNSDSLPHSKSNDSNSDGSRSSESNSDSNNDSSSIEECADAVAAALRQSGVTRCTLVGYSMGARVALALAVRHSDLVGHLGLISGTPGIKVRGSEHACYYECYYSLLLVLLFIGCVFLVCALFSSQLLRCSKLISPSCFLIIHTGPCTRCLACECRRPPSTLATHARHTCLPALLVCTASVEESETAPSVPCTACATWFGAATGAATSTDRATGTDSATRTATATGTATSTDSAAAHCQC